MKRLILLLTVLIAVSSSFAQTFLPRTNGTFTPVDPYLSVPRAFYAPKVCDTLVNPFHGGKDSVGAIIVDTCNHKIWIRDVVGTTHRWIDAANFLVFANGISRSIDSVLLGGPLTKYTFIRTKTNRSDPLALDMNALYIGNVPPDSSAYVNYLGPGNGGYDRGVLMLDRHFYNNDTLLRRYGGVVQGTTEARYDSLNTRFKNIATPIYLGYGGAAMNSRLFPPDTAYWWSSPQGLSASAYSGELGIGGVNKYNLTIIASNPEYPIAVSRMGIDFARTNLFVKREIRGNGIVHYVADWKSDQQSINSGTTEIGSYINKISQFMAYGTVYPHTESPSKAKTLAVSTVDTSIGFYAKPQWSTLNEVKNGYAFINEGTGDYNFFAGNTKFGGSMPSVSNVQTRRVYVDSTIQVGGTLATNTFFTNYWKRLNVTPSNFNSSPIRGVWVQNELHFDQDVNINNTGITAVRGDLDLYVDSVQSLGSTTGVGVMGAAFGLFLRKNAGYTDTTTFKGATTPISCAAALTSRFDMSGTAGSGSENLGTGYFASFQPNFIFSNFNKIDNGIFVNIGTGQWSGTTNMVNGYGIYINGFPSQVTNKYALYQSGTLDTVLINGKFKINNLTAPTGGYNLEVHGDDSLTHQLPVSALIIPSNSVVGTATNNDATAGNIGEYVSSTIASGSAVALANTTTANVTSISLTAGDWDVTGVVDYLMTSATATNFIHGSSTISATLGGQDTYNQKPFAFAGSSATLGDPTPTTRISIASTTTVYLVAQATFSGGSIGAYGTIRARRVR